MTDPSPEKLVPSLRDLIEKAGSSPGLEGYVDELESLFSILDGQVDLWARRANILPNDTSPFRKGETSAYLLCVEELKDLIGSKKDGL